MLRWLMSKASTSRSSSDEPIGATEFKTHCLALLDRVAERGVSLVISKHGKPVARLVPIEPTEVGPSRPLLGSVRIMDPDDELLSTGVGWEAERSAGASAPRSTTRRKGPR